MSCVKSSNYSKYSIDVAITEVNEYIWQVNKRNQIKVKIKPK